MEQNSHLRKNPEVAAAEGFEPALSLTNQEFDTSHSSTSCASLSFFILSSANKLSLRCSSNSMKSLLGFLAGHSTLEREEKCPKA